MAWQIEKYRQSDVNFWGVIAIACVGVAFAASNLSAMLPNQWLSGLHSTRQGGGSFSELQSQVASLREESTRLRTEGGRISTILKLGDSQQKDATKRIGALENSIPILLEQIPLGPNIDSATVTGSVNDQTSPVRQVQGGAVAVTTSPLDGGEVKQKVPAKISAVASPVMLADTAETATSAGLRPLTTEFFGLAMGDSVDLQDAYLYWREIHNNVGALLLGLDPVLSDNQNGEFHLVAGPVNTVADAESLCALILRNGLQCLPVPYSGYELPQ
jgi:hypothetical protein